MNWLCLHHLQLLVVIKRIWTNVDLSLKKKSHVTWNCHLYKPNWEKVERKFFFKYIQCGTPVIYPSCNCGNMCATVHIHSKRRSEFISATMNDNIKQKLNGNKNIIQSSQNQCGYENKCYVLKIKINQKIPECLFF